VRVTHKKQELKRDDEKDKIRYFSNLTTEVTTNIREHRVNDPQPT